MKIQQRKWTPEEGWQIFGNMPATEERLLVFVFGKRNLLENKLQELKLFYPNSDVVISSTSGEILNQEVLDASLVVTAVQFESTLYQTFRVNIHDFDNSFTVGKYLTEKLLQQEGLKHVIVISDGSLVNGSELVKGLNDALPTHITATGGLAGDGDKFEKTLVGYNEEPSTGNVVAIGLYGEDIKVGYGSFGGWDAFGPKRKVTRSKGNILYELDGKSALALYKRYLGSRAAELPSSALLFPLSIQLTPDSKSLVRTILSIDEENQSMVFAGDLPEGAIVQLMKSNYDKLIDGAYEAARSGQSKWNGSQPELALLISCVGRRLVLDQRVEEEVESVQEVIGHQIPMTGFYSYGEISPFAGYLNCELHNQTMTITLLGEK